jgi:Ca-activated chloride channel family protein
VPPGTYTVKAMMMGFKPVEKARIKVVAGKTTVLDFMLDRTIVMKTQEILVTAEKPVVKVTTSDARSSVSSEALSEMPIDDVLDAVALKAGVVPRADEMYVRGGRDIQIQTDGVSVDNPLGGSTTITMGCDASDGAGLQPVRRPREPWNTESYDRIMENPFLAVVDNPYSTFSVDVDAASYSNMRRYVTHGQLPPVDAVRVEEFINYFTYDYPDPEGEHPFSITTEVTRCPWKEENKLVHVGLQGKRVEMKDLPPNNLVFLLDVSGSMRSINKLALVKKAFLLLVDNLRARDRVAIVVYAGAAGLVLPSTTGDEKEAIVAAIKKLEAGGTTAGGAGIKLAYKVAEENFIEDGNNRVILATDGDFNTGVSSNSEMIRLIEEKRESGVFITALGFGYGNLKDSKLEKIADHGNGNYAYIDDIFEARKIFVNELGATLLTIAKDVKIQIEFNPARVEEYRLIGYENRMLKKEDFDDDKKDAGEIGAGHSVTALYEIVPADAGRVANRKDHKSRYMTVSIDSRAYETEELLTVRFRYKEPDARESKLITSTLADSDHGFDSVSEDFRFAAAVAQFGLLLRGSEYAGESSFEDVLATAKQSLGKDEYGYRHEFVRLVEQCRELADDTTP